MRLIGTALLIGSLSQAAEVPYVYLKAFDVPMPVCDSPIRLDAGGDYFVPISNPDPARAAYNTLIHDFDIEQWSVLYQEWESFREQYKGSPLQEAATFLIVQAKFKEASGHRPLHLKEAEKLFREAILLYPKSPLEPVVTATAAAMYLEAQQFQRSLSLFEEARERFSNHPISCLFDLGAAEALFQMRDYNGAQTRLSKILDQCKNLNLKLSARLRLADIEYLRGGPTAEAQYEAITAGGEGIGYRALPSLQFNLGEIKYRQKNYPTARYYFAEYLKRESKHGACIPMALKRMGDMALLVGDPIEKAIGYYLSAKERGPLTDAGRLSRIRSLILGFKQVAKSEQKRRLTLLEEELNAMTEPPWRALGYLEKGLALLDFGYADAMGYLSRMKKDTTYPFTEGEVGSFVRDRILKLVEKDLPKKSVSAELGSLEDAELIASLEEPYKEWLIESQEGEHLQSAAHDLLVNRFMRYAQAGRMIDAVGMLGAWRKSTLWDETLVTEVDRRIVGESLVVSLLESENPIEQVVASVKNEDTLRTFLSGPYSQYWLQVYELAGDKKRAQEILKEKPARATAAQSKISLLAQDAQLLWRAQSYRAGADFENALSVLDRIKEPKLKRNVAFEKWKIAEASSDWESYFSQGKALIRTGKEEEKKEWFEKICEVAQREKKSAWVPEIVQLSQGKWSPDLASKIYFLGGKGAFEKGDMKKSVEWLEKAAATPEFSNKMEAKYFIARGLQKLKRTEQAKVVYSEVVQANDPQWSQLAQNELNQIK